ncbi:uncharacterized protein CANTADRAFT_89828 [Suhomyces tanzawaensis NRRL Y-17324]|uniref:RNI-like protein n=1 Tax=Suhomyces tanzawaensis NRRL Y-17324 TaxID=984487 RepID=A0A1E4SLI1_9ASCO|nr:uncharacterized protein CANTADRAFT_89828 [Suhomyces tanzawaensis NRRL Y-17324]ODV80257.1 hypothetical protein CANTADRAFT_89828 [Suhomyces tanzawaensis NRRL Y-17324]
MSVDAENEEPFSPLVSLPLEILYTIIEIVYYDDNSISINSNLENFANTIPLLLKKIHQLSLCFLYKYAIFNRPHAFDKFLSNLLNSPTIGKYVEYMDFQQFTSIGLGRTGRMNQEIQMVTSATIAKSLGLTPNLIEFLASENIQDDMDVNVLDLLFNQLPKIQALDFCGASSDAFVKAFQQLSSLDNLMKISFHDCSSLTLDIFNKLLPNFTSLTRLDLNHTSINSTVLLNCLPHSVRLTHLSLARCSKLTTKDLINFLTTHPAVANDSLQWLNLQIDTNVVSPLSDVYLLYTLRHLKAPDLKYLNLGGLPVNSRILNVIKNKFTNLESLSISHATVSYDDLASLSESESKLKFLDLTGIKNFSRWNLNQLLKTMFNTSLIAVEFDYKVLFDLTNKGQHIKITPAQQSFIDEATTPQVWKFYDNEGRRAWIYKLDESDPEFSSIINTTSTDSSRGNASFSSNLVYYDLETGNKIVSKVKKPEFLKYASRKISCSIGYYNLRNAKKLRPKENGKYIEDVWPLEFAQRGIYNYYSLNIK